MVLYMAENCCISDLQPGNQIIFFQKKKRTITNSDTACLFCAFAKAIKAEEVEMIQRALYIASYKLSTFKKR